MKNQRYAWLAVALVVLLCFQPSKSLAYTAPYLLVTLTLIFRPTIAILGRLIMWVSVWCLLGLLHFMVQPSFEPQPFFLATITYSSFVVLLVPSSYFSPALFEKVCNFLIPFFTFEAMWGLVQGFYGYHSHSTFDQGNGDVVSGTIGFLVNDATSASNIMFATSMVLIMIALYPVISTRGKGYWRLWVGMAVLMLATVVHLLIFACLAIVASLILCARPSQLRTMYGPLIAVSTLALVMAFLFPQSTRNVNYFAHQFFEGTTPKSELYRETVLVLPRQAPQVMVIGVGPGQFASRAAMISSGAYLSSRVGSNRSVMYSLLEPKSSEFTTRYELPLYNEIEHVAYWGSTQTPFSSWVSVATEFGFLSMIALVVCVVVLVLRLAAIARSAPNQSRRELFSLIASIILLMLLGFQENYWEMPQAIFVGLLLMRFLYESAMSRLRAENTEAMENSPHTPVAHGGEQLVTT